MAYKPMLAKKGGKQILEKDFIFEPKLDGTRALCYYNQEMKLINRRGNKIGYRYPELESIGDNIESNCVLDGEIVVYDEEGNPDFNLLQKREQVDDKVLIKMRSKKIPATYVVFDILEKESRDLTSKPLNKRKEVLAKTVEDGDRIQKILSTRKGQELWSKIKGRGIEGVMAKKIDSKYYQGKRKRQWLKVKNLNTVDCVVVGWTSKQRPLSALALALWKKDQLTYVGRVGTGFDEKTQKEILSKLEKIETEKSPVRYEGKETIQWVKPQLIAEVEYLELTKQNTLRAPSFIRLREDKPVKDCDFRQVK